VCVCVCVYASKFELDQIMAKFLLYINAIALFRYYEKKVINISDGFEQVVLKERQFDIIFIFFLFYIDKEAEKKKMNKTKLMRLIF